MNLISYEISKALMRNNIPLLAIPENLNVACGISSAEDLPRDPSPTRKPSINLLITHPSQLLTQSAASSVQSTAMAHQGHRIVLPSMDFTGGLCAPVGHLPTGPPPQPPLPPRPPTQTISYPQTGEAALNIWIGQNKQDDIDIRPHKRSKWGPANSPTQNTARHQANLSKGIHMEEELEEGEER